MEGGGEEASAIPSRDDDIVSKILPTRDTSIAILDAESIFHKYEYVSFFGRFENHIEGSTIQKYESRIKTIADPSEENKQAFIEIVMASLVERQSVFGALKKYPKTFFVGPTQFDSSDPSKLIPSITKESTADKPWVRDVDRVIWMAPIKYKGETHYYLGSVDIFNDEVSPGTIKYDWIAYLPQFPKGLGITLDLPDVGRLIKGAIFGSLFRDGDLFEKRMDESDTRRNRLVRIRIDEKPGESH